MEAPMDRSLQQNIERLNTALKLCDLIAYSLDHTPLALTDVRGRLERLLLQYTDPSQLPDQEEQVNRVRGNLASIRQEIRSCIRALEPMKTQAAEFYRTTLGVQKESFELLKDGDQQKRNSLAYKFKQTFHSVARLEEMLELISADLMTLSGELERHALENKNIPDIGHFHVEDNTPANPSLSP
jgi:hypothetical protein